MQEWWAGHQVAGERLVFDEFDLVVDDEVVLRGRGRSILRADVHRRLLDLPALPRLLLLPGCALPILVHLPAASVPTHQDRS